MAITINSSSIDKALKNVSSINKGIQKISVSTERNMAMFEKRLKKSELLMNKMAKSAQSISTGLKLASVAFGAMLINKALSAFTSSIGKYGSTSAIFRSNANKSNSLKDLALSRALQLSTGDEQKGLQNSLGQMAANATIAGSDAQSLLLQAGFNPNDFANMSQLDRLKTLIEAFNKMGSNVAFREMFEDISGLKGNELEALSKLMPDIEKNYADLSSTMTKIDPKTLSDTDSAWKKLTYSFEDLFAILTVKVTPYLTAALTKIQKYLMDFINNGGLDKVIGYIKMFFNAINDFIPDLELWKKAFGYLKNTLLILGAILEKIWGLIKAVVKLMELIGAYIASFFTNIEILLYKTFDKIPGVDYSKEIKIAERENESYQQYKDKFKNELDSLTSELFGTKNNNINTIFENPEYLKQTQKIELFLRSSDVQSQLANPTIKQIGK